MATKKRKSQGRRLKTRLRGKKGQAATPFFENVHRAKIKIIGVGGGGGNIVSEISSRAQRFDFVAANTDSQALREVPKKMKSFSFGQDLTAGLGCGMDWELGERAARAEKEKIKRLLEGSDVCVIVAALGGGTGSGAAAAFAEVSQEVRSLTVGIFTMPFAFEGERRKQIAQAALEKVKPFVNAYVVIPNEHIFRLIDQKTPLQEALSALNRRLAAALQGFIDTLALPGLINIDFADVRAILEGRGRLAFINSAEAAGTAKAQEASQAVLTNPLYGYTIKGADRMLFNVMGDRNLKMQEVAHISSAISEYNPKARIIFGMACNSRPKDRLKVTLLAVGCDEEGKKEEVVSRKARKKRGKKKKIFSGPREKTPDQPLARKQEASKERVVEQGSGERKVAASRDRTRRNGMEVKKAVEEELKELEQQEKQWDVPAFLRNKS